MMSDIDIAIMKRRYGVQRTIVTEFNTPAIAAAFARYQHRFASARLLTWWKKTWPQRRWWNEAVIAIGFVIGSLQGKRVSPKLAEQCERVRGELIEDMCGGLAVSACLECGRGLRFHERVALPQALCFVCATRAGLVRICDESLRANLRIAAHRTEPWWQWTLYLQHALRCDDTVLDRSLKYRYTDERGRP